MRYYGEEALGMVETIGMVPALEACDKMWLPAGRRLMRARGLQNRLVR